MFIRRMTLALAATTMLSAPVLAREPTYSERELIESSLRADGYVTWGEIALDDDEWVVEEAQKASGDECDVAIDPQSYEITDEDC